MTSKSSSSSSSRSSLFRAWPNIFKLRKSTMTPCFIVIKCKHTAVSKERARFHEFMANGFQVNMKSARRNYSSLPCSCDNKHIQNYYFLQQNHLFSLLQSLFWILEYFLRIQIRWSVILNYGSGSEFFQDVFVVQEKTCCKIVAQ